MLNVKEFFDALIEHGVSNFLGVPDSLLKNICGYVSDNATPDYDPAKPWTVTLTVVDTATSNPLHVVVPSKSCTQ